MQIAQSQGDMSKKGRILGITTYNNNAANREKDSSKAYKNYIVENLQMLNRHSKMPSILVEKFSRKRNQTEE